MFCWINNHIDFKSPQHKHIDYEVHIYIRYTFYCNVHFHNVKKKNVLIAVLVFGIVNSLRRLTNNIFKSNPAMTINHIIRHNLFLIWTISYILFSCFFLKFAEKYTIGDSFEFDASKEIVLAYRHQLLQCILENPGKRNTAL